MSVINNYIKAIGGREKLDGVKTKTTLLEANMQGTTIQVLNKQTNKNQLYTQVSMMGNIMQKTVLNQSKGYNEIGGKKTEIIGKELDEAIRDAIIFPELKVNQDQIKLNGIVSLNGQDAYEIRWSKNKTVYYSTSDYFKLQEVQSSEIQGKLVNITKIYSDYETVEGIFLPQKTTQNVGSQKINFKVTSIILNEQFSEDIFE